MKIKLKAFTLVELLVVIAIIGLIASLSVIALGNARTKSRDNKRVTDIKQVQTALELFFSDQGRYPTIAEWNTGSLAIAGSMGTTTYMDRIPSAPSVSDGTYCDATSSAYTYTPASDGSDYSLRTCLSGTTGSLGQGILIASPGGNASCGTAKASDREGNSYDTVQVAKQCWLKQNLNLGTRIDGVSDQADANGASVQKFCHSNLDSNCAIYGGLYQWHSAMAFPASCASVIFTNGVGSCGGVTYTVAAKHQGICPVGWHIPTVADFNTLVAAYPNYLDLRAVAPAWNGTNASGFNALPAGYLHSTNRAFLTSIAEFQIGAVYNSTASSYYAYTFSTSNIAVSWAAKLFGLSVRCIKD